MPKKKEASEHKTGKRALSRDLKPADAGKTVLVKGWVADTRRLGKLNFLILRDSSGEIQITAHKDKVDAKVFEAMQKTPKESALEVRGKIVESKQAPGGRELIPDQIEILAESLPVLPIDISDYSKTELSKRLDYRFLDFHNKRTAAIFRIQSEIANAFRKFFNEQEFVEIQPPCIISSSSEGGTELFPVMYFEKPAFLAQSPQLYKQMAACTFEKVTSISPVWRAEKHNTPRHLNEIRQMDIEVAFADDFDVMELLGRAVQFIVKEVKEKNKQELELLKLSLKVPEVKLLSYDETIKLLNKNKVKLKYGEDLHPEAEKKLCEIYPDTVIFVHTWPLSLKPFYIMPKDKELSKGFDAIYGGIEISSGGQRIHIPDLLCERMKAKGLNPDNFKSYIESFRYGAPPHAGWSIGLERITAIITKQENVREACLFPRDRDRLTP